MEAATIFEKKNVNSCKVASLISTVRYSSKKGYPMDFSYIPYYIPHKSATSDMFSSFLSLSHG